jgi:hypothetical protein
MNDFLIDCSFKSHSTGPKFDKFILFFKFSLICKENRL